MQSNFGEHKYRGLGFLVVEDQPEIAKMLQMRCEKDGADVHIAINGEEGLRMAKSYKPNMIILDVMMPITDGITLYRQLQADPDTRKIPVIFVTAAPDRIRDQDDLNIPERQIFEKPFSFAKLLTTIEEILRINT